MTNCAKTYCFETCLSFLHVSESKEPGHDSDELVVSVSFIHCSKVSKGGSILLVGPGLVFRITCALRGLQLLLHYEDEALSSSCETPSQPLTPVRGSSDEPEITFFCDLIPTINFTIHACKKQFYWPRCSSDRNSYTRHNTKGSRES